MTGYDVHGGLCVFYDHDRPKASHDLGVVIERDVEAKAKELELAARFLRAWLEDWRDARGSTT